MNMTKHGSERLKVRGIDLDVAHLINHVIPPVYKRGANLKSMNKKEANYLAKTLRKIANKVEKNAGVELVLTSCESTLITAYRVKSKR
jgi:hypothetical protein